MTVSVTRASRSPVGFGPIRLSGLPPWTHHPFCASSGDIVTRSPAPRRPRPRPPPSHRSNRRLQHYGRTRHDRPGPGFFAGAGSSPEVWSPTAHTSRVARSLSGGGRPPVDPASAFSPPAARADREPRPASLALAVLRCSARSSWRHSIPADVRGGSFDRRQRVAHAPQLCGRAGHAFVDREDATPVVFRSVAQVRSVKPISHAS